LAEESIVGESSPEETISGKGINVEPPGGDEAPPDEDGTPPDEDEMPPGEDGTLPGEDEVSLVIELAASSTAVALGIINAGPVEQKNPLNGWRYSVVGRREGEGGSCDHGDCADGCETAVDRGCGGAVAGSPGAQNTSSHPKPSSMLPSIGKLSTGGNAFVIVSGLDSTDCPIGTGLEMGLDMRDLGEGDPFQVRLSSMFRDGRLVRRLDGGGMVSSYGNLGLRPMDGVGVCFLVDVGVVGAVFADEKTTEGSEWEARERDVGSDDIRSGYTTLGGMS